MGFNRVTHQQHSNAPIRKASSSRAKKVICELRWHSREQIKSKLSPSLAIILPLRVCVYRARLPLFLFHSWTFILLKYFVPPRCGRGVGAAECSGECETIECVRGSKEETKLCALCLRLHWLILSEQRLYLNSSRVVCVCLEASSQPESFFLQLQVCFLICWKSFKRDLCGAVGFVSLWRRKSLLWKPGCTRELWWFQSTSRSWYFALKRANLRAPPAACRGRKHTLPRHIGNRHPAESPDRPFFLHLCSQGKDCN